jgi:hypothetical protein
MSKDNLDNILYILCLALVGATAAVRQGMLEYSQFLTLLLAGITVGITAAKSVKDNDDDERKDK